MNWIPGSTVEFVSGGPKNYAYKSSSGVESWSRVESIFFFIIGHIYCFQY